MTSHALEVDRVCFSVGEQTILERVTFSVAAGETLGIIGPNGSGKTTLFNCISGFYRCESGSVRLGERDVSRLGPHERARAGIARVFQQPGIFRELTLLENLLLAQEGRLSAFARMFEVRSKSEEALQVLEKVGLSHAANRKASVLSGGQLRVLEIVRAMLFGAQVFLLDEPTAGVSPKMKDQVSSLIRTLSEDGRSVLVIEHDVGFIESFCSRMLVLDVGRVVLEGKPAEVKDSSMLQEIYFGSSVP